MRREVSSASFHASIFIPGIGDLGTSLPSPTKTFNFKMYRENDKDLEIEYNNKVIGIPSSNIKFVMYSALTAQPAVKIVKNS